jgi:Xaa-Pro aminopeptidase
MLMHPHEARLAALRAATGRQGLDGFVIPICDEHMSEYVGAYAQRLEWLTGFGGGGGTAVCRQSGDLRRRALHAAGARSGRWTAL